MRPATAVALLLLLAAAALAQPLTPAPSERGLPLLRTFEPKEYAAGPSNWAVVQDARGIVYFGNEAGVLEYDGVRWRVIPTAKQTVVRSLAVAADGRVYVGAVGEIGYIAPNDRGEDVYVSLLGKLPPSLRDFADVWCTWVIGGRDVYFSTASHLIRIRGNDVKVWPAETSFALSFAVRGRFFIREIGRGLMELQNDRLVAVAGMERFADEKIYAMLPWSGDDLLLGTRPNGFFLWDGRSLRPFGSPDLTASLAERLLYRATLLADGSIAAATTKGGVLLIDRDGTLRSTIAKADGLADDPVLALWSEPRGGLWAATAGGISRLEVPARLTIFDQRRGLTGMPDVLLRHQNALYVATTLGVFRLAPDATHDARLEPVAGIPNQTWALVADGSTLLAANNEGLFEIRGLEAHLLRASTRGTMTVLVSKHQPDRLFIGMQDGLASMRRVGDTWRDEGALPGITSEIRMLAEDGEGRLWASTWGEGILRIRFAPNAAPVVERFTVADGLPGDNHNQLFSIGGTVRFWADTAARVFDERRHRFVDDRELAPLFADGPRRLLARDSDDHLLIVNADQPRNSSVVQIARRDAAGVFHIAREGAFALDAASIYAMAEEGSVTWIGTLDGVLRHDRSVRLPAAGAAAFIRHVAQGTTTVFGGTTLGGAAVPRLAHSRSALRFDFGAAAYARAAGNRYQYLLAGYERGWSPWTAETAKEYTNLPPGSYAFRLRARDADGVVGPEATYRFVILTPWYQSVWAWCLYALLFAAAVWAFVRWRLWRINQEKRLLEEKVDLRTHELYEQTQELQRVNAELGSTMSQLARANETLEGLAFLDGLTAVANRRRFEQTLDAEWKRAAREQQPLAVIMLDIDHFKMLNDTYGHAIGDDCLRDVAVALKSQVKRPGDLLARYGGEEFVLVLPGTTGEGAATLAEELRGAVEALHIANERASRGQVTISVGVAAVLTAGGDDSPKELLERADAALYRSKQAGRNRVTVDAGPRDVLQSA